MRGSLNEVESLFKCAAVGAGLPYGVAEDTATAAVCLILCGQDGAAVALAAFATGMQPTQTQQQGKQRRLSGSGVGVCLAAVDALFAGAEEVRIDNVEAPLLLAGFAAAAANDYGAVIRLAFSNATIFTARPGELQTAAALPPPGGQVTLTQTPATTAVLRRPARIEIDDWHWHALQQLAAQIYVPANAASRETGAGAGLTDND